MAHALPAKHVYRIRVVPGRFVVLTLAAQAPIPGALQETPTASAATHALRAINAFHNQGDRLVETAARKSKFATLFAVPQVNVAMPQLEPADVLLIGSAAAAAVNRDKNASTVHAHALRE